MSILKHSYMPLLLHDAMIKPIAKGSKHPFPSANYCGIALASSLSELFEWLI